MAEFAAASPYLDQCNQERDWALLIILASRQFGLIRSDDWPGPFGCIRNHLFRGVSLKILIADDHALFRESLSLMLVRLDDREPTIIQANTSAHAIRLAGQHGDLDMILMDIDMPGISGISAIKMLREVVPDVPIIMISAEDGYHQISKAIDLGARGFIPKTTSAEVMLSALRLVLNGGIYLPEQLLAGYQSHGGDAGMEKQLTPRQMEILRLLQKGEQNKNIAHQLNLSESTVKVHVRGIFTALDARNRSQAVNHAIERGIL